MKTYETRTLPVSVCPTCGIEIDRGTPVKEDMDPKPGDIGLCTKCGEMIVLDKDMKLQVASLDDLINIPPHIHHEISEVQKFIRRERPLG